MKVPSSQLTNKRTSTGKWHFHMWPQGVITYIRAIPSEANILQCCVVHGWRLSHRVLRAVPEDPPPTWVDSSSNVLYLPPWTRWSPRWLHSIWLFCACPCWPNVGLLATCSPPFLKKKKKSIAIHLGRCSFILEQLAAHILHPGSYFSTFFSL